MTYDNFWIHDINFKRHHQYVFIFIAFELSVQRNQLQAEHNKKNLLKISEKIQHTTPHRNLYCCSNIFVLCVDRLSNLWINWCNSRGDRRVFDKIPNTEWNIVDRLIKSTPFGVRVFFCHRALRAFITSFFNFQFTMWQYWSWQFRERERKVNEKQICVNLKRVHYRRHNVAGHTPVNGVRFKVK